MFHSPIPVEPQVHSTNLPPLDECGEPLVALSSLSNKITVYPAYHLQGYEGALTECYLRTGAAALLIKAVQQLPKGYSFVVFDGWRPYQVQKSLYDSFKQSLLAQGWQEGEELTAELRKFVAMPTQDVNRPAPHLSGGAIDLTISGPDGWLDMGTEFDDFSSLAMTRYFENAPADAGNLIAIRNNRRLLYHLMTGVGFTSNPNEWWHYEYGTLTWARKKQTRAIYGGILSLDNVQKIVE